MLKQFYVIILAVLDVATQFENSLTTQQEALNTENASVLTTEANNGFERIDELDKLFGDS